MRRGGIVAGTALCVLSSGALTATPAAAAAPADTVRYAVTDRACDEPTEAGEATCFAIRRVDVPAGTPGATKYTISDSYTPGPSGGYTPSNLLTAYGLNGIPADAGTGQVVAAVDAFNDPKALADLNTFDAQYGLPAEILGTTFQVLNQDGATSPLPADDTTGWSQEESLDIQAIRAICHNCKILLVETNSTSFPDLAAGVAAAVAQGATVVSNSYGGPEGVSPMSSGLKNTITGFYNHPGVVITASTGDDGWYGWDKKLAHSTWVPDNSPSFPATLPNVVSVGGTSLVLNANATRNTEAVWNEEGPETAQHIAHSTSGATGGGCSLNFAAQGWQSSMAGYSTTGCAGTRLAADISALADPYTGFDVYDSYSAGGGSGWGTFGGTSLASPLIAAMFALAGGAQGVSYPSLNLYGQAKSGSGGFYDVTKGFAAYSGVLAKGGNDFCDGDSQATCTANANAHYGTTNPNAVSATGNALATCQLSAGGVSIPNITQCTAAPGFDGPSGLGAPSGLSGFTAMSPTPAFAAPSGAAPGASQAFSGSATDPFPGGSISSYTWHWGDGTSDSVGANASHAFASAGTYTVKLTATDNYGQSGNITHNVTVGISAPKVTVVSPASGPETGGNSVVITGTAFTGATKVEFGRGHPAASFTVNSTTKITAVPRSHSAGLIHVLVTTPNGTSGGVTASNYTFLATPKVTVVSPASGPETGGNSVVITGTAFTGATKVEFGRGHPAASFTVNSATQITAVPRSHSAGLIHVLVTTPNGASGGVTASNYTFLATPKVTGVSPASGPETGGNSVVITGTAFTGATKVEFGRGHPAASFTVNSATQITAMSPAHSAGLIHVLVTTPNGASGGVTASNYTFT